MHRHTDPRPGRDVGCRRHIDGAAARGADIASPCNRSSTARPPKLAYQPLADYIAESSRKSVEIKTAYDYADFWLAMKGGKPYNLVAWSA